MSTITQAEVARRLGLSQGTISNAFRDGGMISEVTRQRVRRAAEQMGYRPNAAARAIRTGRFSSLAVVLPAESAGAGLHFPASLLGSLADHTARANLSMVVADLWLDRMAEDDAYVPHLLRDIRADAAIVNWYAGFGDRADQCMAATGMPVVWMNDRRSQNSVYPDERAAGRMATEHLLELGHTRIGYLACTKSVHFSRRDRRAGVREAVRKAGYELCEPNGLVQPSKTPTEHWRGIAHWLKSEDRPTAVVTYASPETLSLMRGANEAGLRIGHDLSVVQIAEATWANHAAGIDTVEIAWSRVGHEAVAMAQRLLANSEQPQSAVAVAPNTTWRGSCCHVTR